MMTRWAGVLTAQASVEVAIKCELGHISTRVQISQTQSNQGQSRSVKHKAIKDGTSATITWTERRSIQFP